MSDESVSEIPLIAPAVRVHGVGFWRSPAVKFFATGLLTLGLVIPLWMAVSLTGEREQRRDAVIADVGREWATAQMVYGPALVIPYTVSPRDRAGNTVVHHLVVLPETLEVAATAGTEERSVSIYGVPVYSSEIGLKGRFAAFDPAKPSARMSPRSNGTRPASRSAFPISPVSRAPSFR